MKILFVMMIAVVSMMVACSDDSGTGMNPGPNSQEQVDPTFDCRGLDDAACSEFYRLQKEEDVQSKEGTDGTGNEAMTFEEYCELNPAACAAIPDESTY